MKELENLIFRYSIAYNFCGNNTLAKITLAKDFNKRLNETINDI